MSRQRSLSTVLLLVGALAVASPAEAYTINVQAGISSTYDYEECTSTYVGIHFAQFIGVQPSDTGNVGVEGRLWKMGFLLSQVVSSCAAGGQLPATTFVFCGTSWTHTCINPQGPRFQAYSGSGGMTDWSDLHRIVCAEH